VTIELLLPSALKLVGKGLRGGLKEVLNATFYRTDNGIKWRAFNSVSSVANGV